jgi:hypothetical protein
MIGLAVEGKTIGDEIHLPPGGGMLEVEAWAQSVLPFHSLQIVVNGRVAESETLNKGAYQRTLRSRVHIQQSSWIAARCCSEHQVHRGGGYFSVAAHTSPVYVDVGGKHAAIDPADATYMATMLDGGVTWLDKLSIPANAERAAQIRSVFLEAQEALHQRLHKEGQAHRQ